MKTGSYRRDLRRIEHVARLLDDQFRIPGTPLRVGLDGLLGLFPGLGDAATALGAAYVILLAARLGVPRPLLVRMALNVAVDFVLGAVPLLGDVFDVFFKANRRNATLVRDYFAREDAAGSGDDRYPEP